jgi:subtilisin family serine protease
MAKRRNGSRGDSKRASEELEPMAYTPEIQESSIDYDERTESLPLEGLTGRLLATLPPDSRSLANAVAAVSRDFSLRELLNSKDFANAMDPTQMDSAEVILFQDFNIAVFKVDPDQRPGVMGSARNQGMIVEPERWNNPFGMPSERGRAVNLDKGGASCDCAPASLDYFRGFRDGLSRMIEGLEGASSSGDRGLVSAADFSDSATATWGLQATGVVGVTRAGAGVRVAVLDTGFDVTHPDFAGRVVTSESFIPATTRDRNGNLITLTDRSATVDQSGHGTHCIGTACGPRNPHGGPRYGVAHGSEIFNGKVLSVIPGTGGRASGADSWILAGIDWAIKRGCSIISLSLGAPVMPGDTFSMAYETVAKAAMESGVLIVAAAGNESDRDGRYPPSFTRRIRAVASPANCPHIVAVAALEPVTLSGTTLKIGNFSNRHLIDEGGEINLSGPGVAVLSSFPQPRLRLLDGTSQATPHVTGIAALVQEETGKRGTDLYVELRSRVIPQGSRLDYGNGLVHV